MRIGCLPGQTFALSRYWALGFQARLLPGQLSAATGRFPVQFATVALDYKGARATYLRALAHSLRTRRAISHRVPIECRADSQAGNRLAHTNGIPPFAICMSVTSDQRNC